MRTTAPSPSRLSVELGEESQQASAVTAALLGCDVSVPQAACMVQRATSAPALAGAGAGDCGRQKGALLSSQPALRVGRLRPRRRGTEQRKR